MVTIDDDPPVVSVAWINDAVEDGTDGKVEFTRSGGDLASSLTVNFSTSGTATSGTDYTTLSGSAAFAPSSTLFRRNEVGDVAGKFADFVKSRLGGIGDGPANPLNWNDTGAFAVKN